MLILLSPEMISHRMDGDPPHPALEGAFKAELLQSFENPEESLAVNVLSQCFIRNKPPDDAVDERSICFI